MASLQGPRLGEGRQGGGCDSRFGSPCSFDPWDPFHDYGGSSWRRGGVKSDDTAALAHIHVDWLETDKSHIFRADLPGVRKEEVKVTVEDGSVLQISGERTKEQTDVNDKWHRVERRRGSFLRRFRLPENANLDEFKCEMENGVLTVTVPKEETPKNVSR